MNFLSLDHNRFMRLFKTSDSVEPPLSGSKIGRVQDGLSRRGSARHMPRWLKLALMAGGAALFEVTYLFVSQNVSPDSILQWLRSLVDPLLG